MVKAPSISVSLFSLTHSLSVSIHASSKFIYQYEHVRLQVIENTDKFISMQIRQREAKREREREVIARTVSEPAAWCNERPLGGRTRAKPTGAGLVAQ